MNDIKDMPAKIDFFGDIRFSPGGKKVTCRNFYATRGNSTQPSDELILSLIIDRLQQALEELKNERHETRIYHA